MLRVLDTEPLLPLGYFGSPLVRSGTQLFSFLVMSKEEAEEARPGEFMRAAAKDWIFLGE